MKVSILVLIFFFIVSDELISAPIWNKHETNIDIERMRDVEFANGKYIIVGGGVGEGGRIIYSTDLTNWTSATTPQIGEQHGVASCNGMLISVGSASDEESPVVTSTDGVDWIGRAQTINYDINNGALSLRDVACSKNIMIAVGYMGVIDGKNQILRSVDGINWNAIDVPGDYRIFESASYMNDYFYIGGSWNGTSIYRSKTGLVWEKVHEEVAGYISDFAYANGTHYAVAEQPAMILQSFDGANWTHIGPAISGGLLSIEFASNQFVVTGWTMNNNSPIYRSFNGSKWIKEESGVEAALYRVRYLNGKFIATGERYGTSVTGTIYLVSDPLEIPDTNNSLPAVNLLLLRD